MSRMEGAKTRHTTGHHNHNGGGGPPYVGVKGAMARDGRANRGHPKKKGKNQERKGDGQPARSTETTSSYRLLPANHCSDSSVIITTADRTTTNDQPERNSG